MTGAGKKLVIKTEDLPDLPPPGSTPAMAVQGAKESLPSVAGARPAPTAVGGFGGIPVLSSLSTVNSSLVAGVVAAILGWPLADLVLSSMDSASPTSDTAVWVGLFGLVFGAVFCSWDDLVTGVTGRLGSKLAIGAAVGAIVGAISGALAQTIYSAIWESAIQNVTTEAEYLAAYQSPELYAARAIAFAVFGIGMGLAAGITARSQKKAINGVIGGAIGGALGGLILNYIFVNDLIGTEGLARLVSLLALGAGIGLATGLVEVARRQAWLKIASGGMAGKEFIVYHEVTEIGSSPKCQITLIKDPAIAPQHCRLIDQNNARTLESLAGNQTLVNGSPISSQRLKTGDQIQIGATVVAYSEKTPATA